MAQAIAGDPAAIAVGGEDGLPDPGPGEVIGKYRIHEIIDVLEDVPSIHPFLVVGGGGSDGEVVALVPVPQNH